MWLIVTIFWVIAMHTDTVIGKASTVSEKGGNMFKLHSEYKPTGDQPKAIEYLSKGIEEGKKFQTLLGVTGSRKNFHDGKYN